MPPWEQILVQADVKCWQPWLIPLRMCGKTNCKICFWEASCAWKKQNKPGRAPAGSLLQVALSEFRENLGKAIFSFSLLLSLTFASSGVLPGSSKLLGSWKKFSSGFFWSLQNDFHGRELHREKSVVSWLGLYPVGESPELGGHCSAYLMTNAPCFSTFPCCLDSVQLPGQFPT